MEKSSKLKKNFFLLIILTLAGSFIYTLPYFRNYYYDAFMETFKLTNTQMGLCGTYFGLFGAVSYLIGGVIADKFSIKKLIPFSLIVTGGLGFYMLTSPAPMMIIGIHGVWGVTSLMTFWPALIKAIRMLAASDEQGKAFGIFEGGRGISNAVSLAVAVALFGYFAAKSGDLFGINSVIIFYSAATVLLGILSIFFLRKIEEKKEEGESGFNLKMAGKVLKMPATWLLIGIIFCTYTANLSYYYIAPYATAAFGATAVAAAIISTSAQYIRPIAAIGAGIMGDRINSSKVMLAGAVMTVAGVAIVLFTPEKSTIVLILTGCVLIYASMYITQSMHFALMEESHFPAEITGTAVGLICCLGYLPEAVCPFFAGKMLDNFAGTQGYKMIFSAWIAVTVLGIVLVLIWLRMTKEKRKELLEIRKKQNKEKE